MKYRIEQLLRIAIKVIRPEYLILLLALLLFMAMVWLIHIQSGWAYLPAFGLIILAILVKRES